MTDGDADLTVLVTGAGAPGASGIIRSLRQTDEREIHIVGVDMDPDAYGFALVDESHTVPAGGDDDYVPRLGSIVDSCGVDVVLPLTTAELDPLAEHRTAIDATVMVSPREALSVANDKGRLYDFLDREGFEAAPSFRVVETEAGLRDAVEALGYPERPVCLKRPVASGMRGFRILDPGTDRLQQLLTEKPDTAVTTLEEIIPVLTSADSFPVFVVMEYLPGQEYSVDALGMGNEVGPVVPRSRSRTRAGITFEGTVERDERLQTAARDICERLGLEYNVNLQFRYDRDGVPKLIEINPRVAGTIVMCLGAGVNMPYLGVKYALGESVPAVEIEWGTEMVRYWQELFTAPDGSQFTIGPEEGVPNRSP